MSLTGKIALWVVAIAVVAGGIWWWVASNGLNGAPAGSSPSAANATGTSSLPQGNSDQAIAQEMTSIDAQMKGLSSDTATIDQSMNDQPIQQAQ